MTARRGWRRITAAALLTAAGSLVIATWPSPASADSPVRTAWWNTVSGGGQAAPDPTVADGGLHIAVAPGQVLAFGAVLYELAQDATATLELKFSGQGTPVVVACPTKDSSWKEGGDQPADAAPAYDCSLHSFNGSVSADGTTVTFLLDGSAETTPGELSLAILPYMTHDAPGGVGTQLPVDSTLPFSMDVAKPDASSLTITSAAPVPAGGLPNGGGSGGTNPPVTNPGTSGTTSTPGGSSGGAQVPPTLDSGPPPATTATVDNTAPQVAPPAGTVPSTSAMAPTSAGLPKTDNTAHNVALALLVLVAMAVIATSTSNMQRSPRLIGGAGRHATGTAVAAAPVAVVAAPFAGVRGLGRFARERSAPPHPLI
ncbi:MAG TPA: hypothetical protein VFJ98_00195 [Mycobacteriales bacterium]|nr:hypothetical protein [Mycobacteriales bacterium]